MIDITLDGKYVLMQPDENGNNINPDYSPVLDMYAMNIVKRNWPYKIDDNNKVQATVMDMILQEWQMILAYGGSTRGYMPFIKVAEADIDNEVPEGLPNRTYEVCIADCEGEEPVMETRVHTWRTWRDATHPLPEVSEDGYYYFVSYTFGKGLTDSELMTIYNSTDAELVDKIPISDEDSIN